MFEIQLNNFTRYIPRKDVAKSSFYRAETGLFSDVSMSEFSLSQIAIWHWLLTVASLQKSSTIFISVKALDRRITVKQFVKTLEMLQKRHLVKYQVIQKQMNLEKSTEVTRQARNSRNTGVPSPTQKLKELAEGLKSFNEPSHALEMIF